MKIKSNEILNDLAISWDPINEIEPDLFYFKDMDQEITSDTIGPDRTKFVEVGAQWKSYSQLFKNAQK